VHVKLLGKLRDGPIAGCLLLPAPSASMLRLRASMTLTTFAGSRSFGASIFSPACFFLSSSLTASSYSPSGRVSSQALVSLDMCAEWLSRINLIAVLAG
jgi:hypothetical protein